MWLKIILLQILFSYSYIDCEKGLKISQPKDSIDLQNLYEKLQKNQNPKELNAIKKLSQIITDIKQFESQVSKDWISTSHKNGLDEGVSNFITKIVVFIAKVVDIRDFWNSLREGVSTGLTCLACQSMIYIIFSKFFSAETLAFAFTNICFVMHLSDYDVCKGYITSFKDPVNFIRQNTKMGTGEMCALIMGDQCYTGNSANVYWELNFTKKSNEVMDKNFEIRKQLNRKYNILHITDIHLDLEYVPNTSNECHTPYCCRKSGKNMEPNMSAEYWGSYPCDTPIQTLDNWMRHMDWNKIDWSYWTGDVIPHDSWRDSRHKSLKSAKVIFNYFKTFTKNKLVVPAIGNHIAVPVGCFPPPFVGNEHDISWLYNELAEQWSDWLPAEALFSVRYGGYYAIKIKPDFRIIVMNTNYCARLNVWTLYNSIDPANHLQWLMGQLDLAEKAGDFVHIVGHVPPDNRECTQAWLYNYMAIIERYKDIILGQFFGHTHRDEFRVLYSVHNSSKPIGLVTIGPSLTTYEMMNPAYRIMTANKYGEILDMDTYTFNLEEANRDYKAVPKWYHEYSMAQTYSLNSISPEAFDGLIKSVTTNEKTLQTFYKLSHRNCSYAKIICDKRCKTKFIYDTVIANPFLQKPKPIIETIINNN